ncbi:MAG: hypothetical protein ICV83_03025 [Cytophagales bacterium]|nr:hypothetical protein [Cytophagales bacterium]
MEDERIIFGFGIFWFLVALAALILYVWSIIWSYRDAERRGKPGWLVALLVALFSWPLSLIIWFLFRPGITTYGRS